METALPHYTDFHSKNIPVSNLGSALGSRTWMLSFYLILSFLSWKVSEVATKNLNQILWFPITMSNNMTCVCVCAVARSCPTLCDPMDCSPPGSSVHGIFQAGMLESVCHFLLQGILPIEGSSMHFLHLFIDRQILYTEPPGKHHYDLKVGFILMRQILLGK